MIYEELITKMKQVQNALLYYLDREDNIEENYQNLIEIISDQKILDNHYELQSVLYLISEITNNHHRSQHFFDKIEQLIQYLSNSIKQSFTNIKLFNIFKKNKSILLILLQQKILTINQYIIDEMKQLKYQYFLYPEIKSFLNDDNYDYIIRQKERAFKKGIPDDFYEKRKIGQNDDFICQIIREDLIEDFITYVNKNDYLLNSKIKESVYETNPFLIKMTPKLIEYASFFGSIQIFKYLYKNGVDLNPSLWIYAIHGDDPELIHILEENKITPSYEKCIKESIKCHHNSIAYYIQDEITDDEELTEKLDEKILSFGLHYYNYSFFPNEIQNDFPFHLLCKYDYFILVKFFLESKKVYVDEQIFRLFQLFIKFQIFVNL